jgi:hypothetical protein
MNHKNNEAIAQGVVPGLGPFRLIMGSYDCKD